MGAAAPDSKFSQLSGRTYLKGKLGFIQQSGRTYYKDILNFTF